MRKYFNKQFNCTGYEIFAGEYTATVEEVVLTTLVGSCVTVCLMDRQAGVAGMNHFMLASNQKTKIDAVDQLDSRYGTHSMKMLISSMQEKGAIIERMEAKVFGGGKVIDSNVVNVSSDNIKFIVEHMGLLKIPIVASDLGGNYGRKIHFFSNDGTVLLKKV